MKFCDCLVRHWIFCPIKRCMETLISLTLQLPSLNLNVCFILHFCNKICFLGVWTYSTSSILGKSHCNIPSLFNQQIRDRPECSYSSQLTSRRKIQWVISRSQFDSSHKRILSTNISWSEMQPTVPSFSAIASGSDDNMDVTAPSVIAATHLYTVHAYWKWFITKQVNSYLYCQIDGSNYWKCFM